MKNLRLLLFLMLFLCSQSCQEKEQVFPESESLDKTSIPRLINEVEGLFDYDNHDNPEISFIEFDVEFFDENQGKNVESYSWNISYGNNFGPVQITNASKSNFIINNNGLPSTKIKFSFVDVFDALEMTVNDITPDDKFFMNATLKRTDGKVLTFSNTGSNIVGQPTFQGFFQYTPELINMPVYSMLQGSFDAYNEATPSPASSNPCEGTWEGTVRWEAETSPNSIVGIYRIYSTDPTIGIELADDATMGTYYACYPVDSSGSILPLGNIRIQDDNGVLSYVGTSQWGEIYSIIYLEPSDEKLTLEWSHDYGEGGTVVLTRTDGQPWPSYLTCDGC